MSRVRRFFHAARRRTLLLAAALVSTTALAGCGERSPKDDGFCDPDKPRAFSKAPRFASCDELRTNEARLDPSGKIVEDNIHRYIHCCP